jgi:CheY-like chemotaxis protein
MKKPRNKAAASKNPQPGPPLLVRPAVATVLHIDDDPNDTELFQAAARRAQVRFSVQNVTDGEQAMAYLKGRGLYANRQLYPSPALVLLDLKMPRATGFDVLKWIRHHPEVGNIPVVVFSGSELRDDIQQAYAVGADSYLVKPIGFNALVELVKNIDAAWIAGQPPRASLLAAREAGQTWHASADWIDAAGGPTARP